MNEILDKEALHPDIRLIGNNRVGYAFMAGVSLVGAFVSSALFGAEEDAVALIPFVGFILWGLFNVAGILRPRWLLLSPEGLRYRPVFGSERFILWVDIKSVDYIFIDREVGILTYRETGGRSRGLGLWRGISLLIRDIESWRASHT